MQCPERAKPQTESGPAVAGGGEGGCSWVWGSFCGDESVFQFNSRGGCVA